MRRLAQLGAERRLEELRQEEASILAAFPDLRAGTTGRRGQRRARGEASAPAAADTPKQGARQSANQGGGATRRRKRRTMSAAQKKAVSERMRKYWAARRKAEG